MAKNCRFSVQTATLPVHTRQLDGLLNRDKTCPLLACYTSRRGLKWRTSSPPQRYPSTTCTNTKEPSGNHSWVFNRGGQRIGTRYMGIFRDVCPFFGEQQKLGRERHVEIYFRPSGAPFLDGSTFRHHLYIRNDAVCNISYLSACLNSELWPSATNSGWKHVPCKTVVDRPINSRRDLRRSRILRSI